MHDQIGQSLTALTIQAERGAETKSRSIPRAARADRADRAPKPSMTCAGIGRELRPEALDDLGLGDALIALCRRSGTAAGVRVSAYR